MTSCADPREWLKQIKEDGLPLFLAKRYYYAKLVGFAESSSGNAEIEKMKLEQAPPEEM